MRALAMTALLLAAACSRPGPFGHFVGTVKTEWIEPDRKMRLLDDFAYVDPSGVEWKAPKGSVVDGASIPQVLWSVVGSPYTGEYRNASVVHDVACEERDRTWQDVHRMFYEACRAGGVGEQKAKLMYAAVYHFGPKWGPGGTSMFFLRTMPVEKEFAQLKTFVETENPSLEQIEKFEPRR
ncbi:MAG TPA: DUF1353 domain-containing protein [Thermoanaerobaculia bacterium]